MEKLHYRLSAGKEIIADNAKQQLLLLTQQVRIYTQQVVVCTFKVVL